MARSKFIHCPNCYWRLAISDGADIAFDLEMHRLSGNCRAQAPPKDRAERKTTNNGLGRLNDWMGGDD
jgi:hypothetical protein